MNSITYITFLFYTEVMAVRKRAMQLPFWDEFVAGLIANYTTDVREVTVSDPLIIWHLLNVLYSKHVILIVECITEVS